MVWILTIINLLVGPTGPGGFGRCPGRPVTAACVAQEAHGVSAAQVLLRWALQQPWTAAGKLADGPPQVPQFLLDGTGFVIWIVANESGFDPAPLGAQLERLPGHVETRESSHSEKKRRARCHGSASDRFRRLNNSSGTRSTQKLKAP